MVDYLPKNSTTTPTHTEWHPRNKDIKSYFHFDAKLSEGSLKKLALDNDAVAKHAFMPLIRFKEKWLKFRKNGAKKIKSRPIRYACRKDAIIYAYHRYNISIHYEKYLKEKGIENIPIAYRKISKENGGNKSNIEFAKDAFDFIRATGDCDVTIVDISSFFESLDHNLLKVAWQKIIGRKLNAAETAVFKSITKYSVVDIKPLFDRLELFERAGTTTKDKRKRKIDLLKDQHFKRVTERGEFKNKVCGGDPKLPSLIQKHNLNFGIPQGTPISDILANIYLIDFDVKLARWIRNKNGFATRYSDDIIIIIPKSENLSFDSAFDYLVKLINNYGSELEIKPSKTAIGRFINTKSGQIYTHIKGDSCQNGIEYLGFQFNGEYVSLKNSTLSNAWRKLKKRAHGWAKKYVKRNRNRGDLWLSTNANLQDKCTETLRTMTLKQSKDAETSDWTFISYVRRAEKSFSDYNTKFPSQTRKYKKEAYRIYEEALTEAIGRHGKDKYLEQGGKL